MPRLSIRLLGPIQVTLDGDPVTDLATDKVRALLAYLAVEAHKPHRRQTLAGLFWAEYSESAARANLRRALANLRQALGDRDAEPPFLLINRQTIQFHRTGDTWVDVNTFTELVEGDGTIGQLEEAVELYRGSFLEGFSVGDSAAFEEWSLLQREQLARQISIALHRLTDHYETSGAYDQALAHAWQHVGLDPWREGTQRQVMRLLALSGQRSAALAQFDTMRRALTTELGVEPEAESVQLYEQIRVERLELPSRPSQPETPDHETRVVGDCPYRGLAAFREVDAPFFYGRDDFIGRLLEAVKQQKVVAVIVGSSGSGKSSTVFAGLLPRLRDESDVLIAQFRPGSQPFHALASAMIALLEPQMSETDRLVETSRLAAALLNGEVRLGDVVERVLARNEATSRLLLFVDQTEELYTLCPEPELQHRFLDGLLTAVTAGSEPRDSPIVLLLTLRADFMGQALSYRPFADALQDASLMMGPMSRHELRLAIEQPAATQGAAFEAGLVERLLDDVGEEPGNLPLLEFALTLLWEKQTDGWLTHGGYEEIGRVDGALARYADKVYEGLDARRRERARRVYEQLVRPGEGTDDTRRVATRAELGDENWALVHHLADKRLVITGRDASGEETVEVVHEALIQRWGLLQAWMDDDRSFRTWQEGVRVALRGWKASDHDEGALLRGTPLAQAENWMAGRANELSEAEREYIEAGTALRERTKSERERRRRLTIFGLVAGLVATTTLAILALNARAGAQREADVNRSLVLAADATAASENGETDVALALALEAVNIDEPPPEARRSLSAIAQGAGTRAILEGHSQEVRHAAFSPDARLALSGSCSQLGPGDVCSQGELILWDLARGNAAARFEGHSGWVNGVAFSPDGRTALSGSGDATLILWDVDTGDVIRRFEGHAAGVNTVAFDPDGQTALSGSDDGTLILWDVNTGEAIRRLEGHSGGVTRAVFGPDTPEGPSGEIALSTSHDSTLILWNVNAGEAIRSFEGHQNTVTDAVISPDGLTILSVARDLSLRRWSLETGQETEQHALFAHPASLAISPDGRTALMSVKVDISQWDMGLWQESGRLSGHGLGASQAGNVNSIAISSDGMLALSAGSDRTLRLWNLSGQIISRRFDTDGTPIDAVAISPDGSRLLTGLATGETVLWDIEQGQVLQRFGGEGFGVAPDCVAFSPDSPEGTSALVCAEDVVGDSGATSLVLWDLATGEEIRRFDGHTTYVRALAFAPDGRSALAGSQSLPDNKVGDLILWDLETGNAIRHFDMDHDVTNIAISADGSLALTGSVTGTVAILWEMETGREIRRFEGHTLPVLNVAFGPEEESVITASIDGSLIRWNIHTGEIIRRYLGHESWVLGLDVSPDGRRVISSSGDGTVILWDLESGEELRRFPVHVGWVFDVAFHPNGQTAFSVGLDGDLLQLRVADPSLDELVDWVNANRYVRELTCAERQQYHVEPSDCQASENLP